MKKELMIEKANCANCGRQMDEPKKDYDIYCNQSACFEVLKNIIMNKAKNK